MWIFDLNYFMLVLEFVKWCRIVEEFFEVMDFIVNGENGEILKNRLWLVLSIVFLMFLVLWKDC